MESANRELVQALRLLNETEIDDFKELMTLVALDPLKDLQGADLSGANLIGANLSEANLIGANLSGAIFIKANLSGADLSEADFSGAKLIESTLDADSSSDSSVA